MMIKNRIRIKKNIVNIPLHSFNNNVVSTRYMSEAVLVTDLKQTNK